MKASFVILSAILSLAYSGSAPAKNKTPIPRSVSVSVSSYDHFKAALACSAQIEDNAVWHETKLLNTRYESTSASCIGKDGSQAEYGRTYYIINLGSNGQSNGTYTTYTATGDEIRSEEEDFILRRSQVAHGEDWHQLACRFDDISPKGYSMSDINYLFGVNKISNTVQLVMDRKDCDGKVVISFQPVAVRGKYDKDLAIQYFTQHVPLRDGDYYSIGCTLSARASSNRPCSQQTNTDVRLSGESKASAAAGELVKGADGKLLNINQYEAITVCERLGMRLPTFRELLQKEVKNGIEILEVADYEAGNFPSGSSKEDFAKVKEANPSTGKEDQFYYSNNHYKVATRDLGTNSIWASFIDTRPGYGWGYVFDGLTGNLKYDYRDIRKFTVRCEDR